MSALRALDAIILAPSNLRQTRSSRRLPKLCAPNLTPISGDSHYHIGRCNVCIVLLLPIRRWTRPLTISRHLLSAVVASTTIPAKNVVRFTLQSGPFCPTYGHRHSLCACFSGRVRPHQVGNNRSRCFSLRVGLVVSLLYSYACMVWHPSLLDPAHAVISHHGTETGGHRKDADPIAFEVCPHHAAVSSTCKTRERSYLCVVGLRATCFGCVLQQRTGALGVSNLVVALIETITMSSTVCQCLFGAFADHACADICKPCPCLGNAGYVRR